MSQANFKENSIRRLKKEKEVYEKEIETFKNKLNSLGKAIDVYNKKLLEDQIEETRKALEMVNTRLMDYEKMDV